METLPHTMTSTVEEHHCTFVGCNKSFKRQEHLLRHEKIHDPLNVYICQVCGKKFNRKDSLNRHVILHTEVTAVGSGKKVKRACETCRKGKTKCDGEEQCQVCIKKGLQCVYTDDKHGDNDTEIVGHPSVEVVPSIPAFTQPPIVADLIIQGSLESSHRKTIPADSYNILHPGPLPSLFKTLQPEVLSPPVPQIKPINWGSLTIQSDGNSEAEVPDTQMTLKNPGNDPYLHAYFAHFHNHWPLVHRIMGTDYSDYSILLPSVRLNGAWAMGTEDSCQFARTTHESLMSHILLELLNITSDDRFQGNLSANLCHSALLNIIFALYVGETKLLSRAALLLHTLVGALREAHFFDKSIAYRDQQASFFPPMSMGFGGQRNRLAAFLYKAGACLSMLRGQSHILTIEELHFPPPSTFALYDCNGLDIWDERQRLEPISRNSLTIYSIATASTSIMLNSQQPVLIEDIDMKLANLSARIWQFVQHRRNLESDPTETKLESMSLEGQLMVCKAHIEAIVYQRVESGPAFGNEPTLPFRYYFGFEHSTTTNSERQQETTARVESLLLSTIMNYHVVSLQLIADITLLSQHARDQHLSDIEKQADLQTSARTHREALVKKWALTPDARRALCHAVDVFTAHQTIRASSRSEVDSTHSLTPVSNNATVFAALVVWTYCTYAPEGCLACVPGNPNDTVDLTKWSNMGLEANKDERNTWIDLGQLFRPKIDELQICVCNINFFMALYRQFLPAGWEGGRMVFGKLWDSFV